MRRPFFYLYLVCALISLGLLAYQIVPVFPGFTNTLFLFNLVVTIFFGYLAFKAAVTKKDSELM